MHWIEQHLPYFHFHSGLFYSLFRWPETHSLLLLYWTNSYSSSNIASSRKTSLPCLNNTNSTTPDRTRFPLLMFLQNPVTFCNGTSTFIFYSFLVRSWTESFIFEVYVPNINFKCFFYFFGVVVGWKDGRWDYKWGRR